MTDSDSHASPLEIRTWKENSSSEISFWKKWVESSGDKWPKDFENRVNPNNPLPILLEQVLKKNGAPKGSRVKILDVGSGPISFIGTNSDHYNVDLTAVDPLADKYNDILDKHNITVQVRPQKAYVETLNNIFDADEFDAVWCCNALDHSIDPFLGLLNMIKVVKPGSSVLLLFHRNEATDANYSGLHQWDFDVSKDGILMFKRHGMTLNVSALLTKVADVSIGNMAGGKKDRVIVNIKKRNQVNLTEMIMA